MVSHSRKILLYISILVLAGLLFGLESPMPVHADVGVRPILPGGSNIQPDEQTPIQMASELVTITVRQATSTDNDILLLNPEAYGLQFQDVWFSYVAEVSADFTMHNPTAQTVGLLPGFPWPPACKVSAGSSTQTRLYPASPAFRWMWMELHLTTLPMSCLIQKEWIDLPCPGPAFLSPFLRTPTHKSMLATLCLSAQL